MTTARWDGGVERFSAALLKALAVSRDIARGSDGLETAEYALLAGMVAALGVALMPQFSDAVAAVYNNVTNVLVTALNS